MLCNPCETAGGTTAEWMVVCEVVGLSAQSWDTAGVNAVVSFMGQQRWTQSFDLEKIQLYLATQWRMIKRTETPMMIRQMKWMELVTTLTMTRKEMILMMMKIIRHSYSHNTCKSLVTGDNRLTAFSGVICCWDAQEVKPELVERILPPTSDNEDNDSEPWLELCEGHWVVWVSSPVTVGEIWLWSRLTGCLTVPAMTVKTEEKAGCPDKPSPLDSESPSEWTAEKGTSSATDRWVNGWTRAAVAAGSLGRDEEPEAS